MALGSNEPLTEMSTRNISWGVKADGAYGWQPYHSYVPTVLKSESLNLLVPPRPLQELLYPFKEIYDTNQYLNYNYVRLLLIRSIVHG
jgi:hypothetical protein